MTAMPWVRDDGGRCLAGFRGDANDCACRAISIALQMDYRHTYALINAAAQQLERKVPGRRRSSAREGVYTPLMRKLMSELGWDWHPTMSIGKGCAVHLAEGELPDGRLIARVSRHYAAVIDHVVHDTYDPTRDGTRCVYGYWAPR